MENTLLDSFLKKKLPASGSMLELSVPSSKCEKDVQ